MRGEYIGHEQFNPPYTRRCDLSQVAIVFYQNASKRIAQTPNVTGGRLWFLDYFAHVLNIADHRQG
jgi:hypothetical protein